MENFKNRLIQCEVTRYKGSEQQRVQKHFTTMLVITGLHSEQRLLGTLLVLLQPCHLYRGRFPAPLITAKKSIRH